MTTTATEKQNRFRRAFASYVCAGDTIEATVGPFTVTASIVFDEDSHIDDDDCHNPDQRVTGCNDEQFEKLLAARSLWFADQWFYCGVVLSVSLTGDRIELDDIAASLWGIECNYPSDDASGYANAYLTEVANELLDEAVAAGCKRLEAMHLAAEKALAELKAAQQPAAVGPDSVPDYCDGRR